MIKISFPVNTSVYGKIIVKWRLLMNFTEVNMSQVLYLCE